MLIRVRPSGKLPGYDHVVRVFPFMVLYIPVPSLFSVGQSAHKTGPVGHPQKQNIIKIMLGLLSIEQDCSVQYTVTSYFGGSWKTSRCRLTR